MASGSSKLRVFFVFFLLSSLAPHSCGINRTMEDAVKEIFLTKSFNSSGSELILKSARESYLYLRGIEKESRADEKLNFAKNYAKFLLKLFNEVQTKDVEAYELFSKENSFLKGYNFSQEGADFNKTEVKTIIEKLQIAAERHLIAYYNSSSECYEASEVLALNQTSFDTFLIEKLRADYSQIGYFFLEVFATLIGLSWGLISTVIYVTESSVETASVL